MYDSFLLHARLSYSQIRESHVEKNLALALVQQTVVSSSDLGPYFDPSPLLHCMAPQRAHPPRHVAKEPRKKQYAGLVWVVGAERLVHKTKTSGQRHRQKIAPIAFAVTLC
jgi:hypothetical protein